MNPRAKIASQYFTRPLSLAVWWYRAPGSVTQGQDPESLPIVIRVLCKYCLPFPWLRSEVQWILLLLHGKFGENSLAMCLKHIT